MKLPKVLHITNIASLYRRSQWEKLITNKKLDYHFVFGENTYSGIKTIDTSLPPFTSHSNQIHQIKNHWVQKKYLIWQSGVLRMCFTTSAKLVILLGEFNVLSNWFATLILRARGITTVYRGHGMYGNEKGLKLFLRKNYYKLANAHLLYERRGKRIMTEQGFDPNKLHIIFNSLDYDKHKNARHRIASYEKGSVFKFFENPEFPTLIFVGRLTKVKKIELLLKAKSILDKTDTKTNLLIVGDGSERNALEEYADALLKKGTFHFYVACYDEKTNEAFLACSDICVSPGNVGLTAIHSLSYGTPVITHGNFENQMPEVEAISENKTGLFFTEGNAHDLAEKIRLWLLQHKKDRNQIREDCYRIIDQYYNPYYQVKVIENLVFEKPPLV